MNELVRRWESLSWFDPVDATAFVAFRRVFLAVAALYTAVWSRHAPEWLTARGFHPTPAGSDFYAPRLPLVSEGLVWVVVAIFLGALVVGALGRRHSVVRPALAVSLCGAVYVLQADPISAFTINRLNVVVLAVLVAAPWPRDNRMVAWPIRILQLTLVIQYLTAGWCKVVLGDWPGEGDVLWMQVQGHYRTDMAAYLVRALPRSAWAALQHVALAFEVLAPALFGIARLRPFGLAAGVVMHIIIALTMESLIYFSLQMVAFYLLFLPPTGARMLRPLR